MKYLPLIILIFLGNYSIAQDDTKRKNGDFHEREALTIDELLKRNDPNAYKALTTNNNFLVVANYRNGKRWRYFEGDIFRFKTKDGRYYEEEVSYIDDSTFTIYHYNNQINRLEVLEFEISEISAVYKDKRTNILRPGLISMLNIVPWALIDWAATGDHPFINKDFLIITPVVGVGNILIFGRKGFFNKIKLRGNKELKIINPAEQP